MGCCRSRESESDDDGLVSVRVESSQRRRKEDTSHHRPDPSGNYPNVSRLVEKTPRRANSGWVDVAASRGNAAPGRANTVASRGNVAPSRANVAPSRANVAPSRANTVASRAKAGEVRANAGGVWNNTGTVWNNAGAVRANTGAFQANTGAYLANTGAYLANAGAVRAHVPPPPAQAKAGPRHHPSSARNLLVQVDSEEEDDRDEVESIGHSSQHNEERHFFHIFFSVLDHLPGHQGVFRRWEREAQRAGGGRCDMATVWDEPAGYVKTLQRVKMLVHNKGFRPNDRAKLADWAAKVVRRRAAQYNKAKARGQDDPKHLKVLEEWRGVSATFKENF